MTKITKKILSLILALVMLVSIGLPTFSAERETLIVYSSKSNSGERDEICLTLEGTGALDYYTDGRYDSETLSTLESDELFSSLRTLMTETHTTITKYDNCRDYATITDCENNDGRIVMFYTSYSATYDDYNKGQGWNREHLWPQSLGGDPLGVGEKLGGADLHHIRPVESNVNSTRGNKPYGNADGGKSVYGKFDSSIGGTYTSYYEPNDNVKGDVARIILYVYVRWGSEWGADSVTEVFESIDVLLEWCAEDPVDTWEMGRNEVVENIQGNRNVFIDYPEYAWLLFDRDVPYDMTTPSGLAAEIGIKPCDHENTELRGVLDARCEDDGYSGDIYCADCGELLQVGNATYPIGHSFGEWVDTPFGYERACLNCGTKEYIYINSIFERIDSDAEKILLLLTLGVCDEIFYDIVNE